MRDNLMNLVLTLADVKFSPGSSATIFRQKSQLTYICDVYLESCLVTIHIEVMMIHDQRWLDQPSTVIVQRKLVSHRTMATLYLRHYHRWILILKLLFNLAFVQTNLAEVFALTCHYLFFSAEGTSVF
jgi:hypothetical protein